VTDRGGKLDLLQRVGCAVAGVAWCLLVALLVLWSSGSSWWAWLRGK
jgi:hypothetical protein